MRDYRRVMAHFLMRHPIDKAMALAVGGGDYDINGVPSNAMRFCRPGLNLGIRWWTSGAAAGGSPRNCHGASVMRSHTLGSTSFLR